MTNQDRQLVFRRWRQLVELHPKSFRIQMSAQFGTFQCWLEEYVKRSTFQVPYSGCAVKTGGGPEWGWDVAQELPEWEL